MAFIVGHRAGIFKLFINKFIFEQPIITHQRHELCMSFTTDELSTYYNVTLYNNSTEADYYNYRRRRSRLLRIQILRNVVTVTTQFY